MNKSILAGFLALTSLGSSIALAAPTLTLDTNPLWIRTAGSVGETVITATGDNQRGLAYNPVTGNLYVADRNPLTIKILNGATGAQTGLLNTTGITGGAIALTKVGASGDGAIYATNLSTDGGGTTSPFKIYRWASELDAIANP